MTILLGYFAIENQIAVLYVPLLILETLVGVIFPGKSLQSAGLVSIVFKYDALDTLHESSYGDVWVRLEERRST